MICKQKNTPLITKFPKVIITKLLIIIYNNYINIITKLINATRTIENVFSPSS